MKDDTLTQTFFIGKILNDSDPESYAFCYYRFMNGEFTLYKVMPDPQNIYALGKEVKKYAKNFAEPLTEMQYVIKTFETPTIIHTIKQKEEKAELIHFLIPLTKEELSLFYEAYIATSWGMVF